MWHGGCSGTTCDVTGCHVMGYAAMHWGPCSKNAGLESCNPCLETMIERESWLLGASRECVKAAGTVEECM